MSDSVESPEEAVKQVERELVSERIRQLVGDNQESWGQYVGKGDDLKFGAKSEAKKRVLETLLSDKLKSGVPLSDAIKELTRTINLGDNVDVKVKKKDNSDGYDEVDCTECGGSGVGFSQKCYLCNGTGIKDGNKCAGCLGSGSEKEDCAHCSGSGHINVKKQSPAMVNLIKNLKANDAYDILLKIHGNGDKVLDRINTVMQSHGNDANQALAALSQEVEEHKKQGYRTDTPDYSAPTSDKPATQEPSSEVPVVSTEEPKPEIPADEVDDEDEDEDRTCPDCNGEGKLPDGKVCHTCDGQGEIDPSKCSDCLGSGTCRLCSGSGEIIGKKGKTKTCPHCKGQMDCPTCKGSGNVPEEDTIDNDDSGPSDEDAFDDEKDKYVSGNDDRDDDFYQNLKA